jgi:hypothetical protein
MGHRAQVIKFKKSDYYLAGAAKISRRRRVPRNSNLHNNTLASLLPEKEDLLAADGQWPIYVDVVTELANLTLLTHSDYSTPMELLAEYLVYAKDDSRTILRQALIICGASTVTISLRSTELKSMRPSMHTPGRSPGFTAAVVC